MWYIPAILSEKYYDGRIGNMLNSYQAISVLSRFIKTFVNKSGQEGFVNAQIFYKIIKL